MIAYKGMPKATPAEFAHMDRVRELGCMACALKGDVSKKKVDIHHLLRGGKRVGHMYVIPLCNAHHQGNRGSSEPAVHKGMKAFRAAFGYDDWGLWQKLQCMLGLDDTPPPSKIVPRRLPTPEKGNGGTVGRAIAETTRDIPEAEVSR